MKVLSFVIPAYNSQAFLGKCLDSMLVPQLLDKLEILVVNDGSTDATGEIALRYQTRYPGTVKLLNQENKGHGGALNTGCAAAAGKYIKVIDADDWVLTENLAAFVSALEACSSDVVLTHYHTIDIQTGQVKNWRHYPEEFERDYTLEEIMSNWKSFDRSLTFHGITYNRAFYQAHAVPLLEHVFYEDHQYATFPCCLARSVMPLDLFLYEYRIGDVDQSVSVENQCRRIGHTQAVLQRMMEQFALLPEGAGQAYAAMKIQGLLLSYLTTALLVLPDRAKGRELARKQLAQCQELVPQAGIPAEKKYRVLLMLNLLHIPKSAWDRVLASRLYNRLRNNHRFD